MSDTKECPVCHNKISLAAEVCPICGMDELNRIFLSSTEYNEWVHEVLNVRIEKFKELSCEDAGKRFGVSQMLKKYYSYSGPIPEIEMKKFNMSEKAVRCIKEKKFLQAADLLEEIALICHQQGKEEDAYLLEHKAFLCRQEHICRKAGFLTDVFWKVPEGIPYVGILQNTLSRLAEKYREEQKDYFVLCKLVNARLCRVRGRERDAFLLEDSVYKEVNWNPVSVETMNFVDQSLEGKGSKFLQALIEEYIKDYNESQKNKSEFGNL